MFVKKSQAEIAQMSDAEAEKYATEKEAHDTEVAKKTIDEAVKAAKEEAVKEANDATKKQIDDLTAIVEKQGEEIAKGANNHQGINSANLEEFKKQIKSIHEQTSKSGVIGEPVKLKSFTGDDAMGVENFPNAAGNGSITGALASITQYFAQLIPGIFKRPVPTSNILDYCRIEPLNGEQLVTISETRTVNMSVTAEGVEKPVSKASWTASTETAKPIPTLFKTTSQMRKFFPTFVTSFYNTLLMYLDKVIPEFVIAKINASGTAFSPVTAQAIYSAPNEYDVIVQAIASLLKLGYVPNVVKVSIFTYSKLKTLRGTTNDAYLLQNYGSVNIVDGTINFGKLKITLDTDPSFGDDDYVVGDLSTVIVGLDSNIEYVEAYEGSDLKNNKKSHLLEKYVAVNIPTATRTGITKDTFTNSIALLTA